MSTGDRGVEACTYGISEKSGTPMEFHIRQAAEPFCPSRPASSPNK
jgi:hypothetical protein